MIVAHWIKNAGIAGVLAAGRGTGGACPGRHSLASRPSFPEIAGTPSYGAAEVFPKHAAPCRVASSKSRSTRPVNWMPAFMWSTACKTARSRLATRCLLLLLRQGSRDRRAAILFESQQPPDDGSMIEGNGRAGERLYAKCTTLIKLAGGNTGAQMGGGWFRKEIKSPADIEGPCSASAASAGKQGDRAHGWRAAKHGRRILPSPSRAGTIEPPSGWVRTTISFQQGRTVPLLPRLVGSGPEVDFFIKRQGSQRSARRAQGHRRSRAAGCAR